MKFQHLFVAAITAVSLMGCATEPPLPPVSRSAPNADQQSELVHAVLDGLKDADSAKFGRITVIDGGKGACVTVNAKNSAGGYNGFQQAILSNLSMTNMGMSGWLLVGIMDVSHELCIDALHHELNK